MPMWSWIWQGKCKWQQEGLSQIVKSKKTTRENVGLFLNGTADLAIRDVEKVETFHAFFTLVFTSKTCLQELQTRKAYSQYWRRIRFGSLQKLDAYKYVGSNGMHPSVQTELTSVILRLLTITEGHGDWRRVLRTGRKQMSSLSLKRAKRNL